MIQSLGIAVLVSCLNYLTYLGQLFIDQYRKKKYAEHVTLDENPTSTSLQGTIRSRYSWFNPTMVLVSLGVGAAVFWVHWQYYTDVEVNQILYDFFHCNPFDPIFGMIIMSYVISLSTIVWHFLLYRYAINHPQELAGQVKFSTRLVMHQLFYQVLSEAIPLMGILLFQPGPFVLGAILASITLALTQWLGLRRMAKERS